MRVLAVSLITFVFLATVGLGWLFDYLYQSYVDEDTKAPVTNIVAIEKFGVDLQHLANKPSVDLVSFIANWPQDGNYSLSLLPLTELPLPQELQQQLLDGDPLTLASEDDIAIYYYLDTQQKLLVLTSPLMRQQSTVSLNRYLFTGLFYLCLLVLMLLWLYPLINRLLALRQMAKTFGRGDLTQRVDVGSVSYIRDLELEFNHMAQRISDLVGDVKLLSSAVSHDLRTPLATIRFGIDTLQEEDDPVLRKKFEQRISDNVDEMIELVEILLNYARLDQNLVTLEKAPTQVSKVLEQCVETQRHDHIKITVINNVNPEPLVVADRKYLAMLFNNLLKNATQHCQNQVTIALSESTSALCISVSDDGPGIEAEQTQEIIKPFVRGQNQHKGYGIGLAIVQRIIHWHNGELEIDRDIQLKGAKFSVYLPKHN